MCFNICFCLENAIPTKKIKKISRRSCCFPAAVMSNVFSERDPNKRLCCWPLKPSEKYLKTLYLFSENGRARLICPVALQFTKISRPFFIWFGSIWSTKTYGKIFLGQQTQPSLRKNSSNVYWGYIKLLLSTFSKRFKKKRKKVFSLKKTGSHFPFFLFHLLIS